MKFCCFAYLVMFLTNLLAAEAKDLEGDNPESSKVFEKVSDSSKLPVQTASKNADDKISRHSVHGDKSKSESLTMSERGGKLNFLFGLTCKVTVFLWNHWIHSFWRII